MLFAFRELLVRRREELAAAITAEHGKVLDDALGEVQRGLEVVEFACGIAAPAQGRRSPRASRRGVDVHSIRQPLGVVAVISPFNFPAMVPMWFVPVAIACGNTVVLKPQREGPVAPRCCSPSCGPRPGCPTASSTSCTATRRPSTRCSTHPDVKAVSFVGSTPIARYVYETGTAHGKRVQALGGAKNHMVVLPDADLDLAADAAVNAGFGSAGERCMAISVAGRGRPGRRRAGAEDRGADGRAAHRRRPRRGCDMGPLVTGAHRDKVASYLDAGRRGRRDARRRRPRRGGRRDAEDGFWLGPTLFDHVTPGMPVYNDEIFGPVLSVVRVASYDEALALVNDNPYGNGTAIFTHDGGAARRFQHEVEVGMVGVNVPIPVPMAYYSFGGWKASLFGDTHAHGTEGVHFFTRGKVVTSRWPDPSTGGIDLGFPRLRS